MLILLTFCFSSSYAFFLTWILSIFQCNVHHWEALFRHFDAYFKAYVSCRKDLLLLDIESDNSGSFPKHAVLQILRVTQVILENCQGKSSFSGLEVWLFSIFYFVNSIKYANNLVANF